MSTKQYYTCCGKSICRECVYSFCESGNIGNYPFCKAQYLDKTDEENVQELMKRVEANDASAMYALGNYYHHGRQGIRQVRDKEVELWKQAAELGSSQAHYHLGNVYYEGGDS